MCDETAIQAGDHSAGSTRHSGFPWIEAGRFLNRYTIVRPRLPFADSLSTAVPAGASSPMPSRLNGDPVSGEGGRT